MEILGISQIDVLADRSANITLSVLWETELIEKLKLNNPSINIKVNQKGIFIDKESINIQDEGYSTIYFVHDEERYKIINYINKIKEELVQKINIEAS